MADLLPVTHRSCGYFTHPLTVGGHLSYTVNSQHSWPTVPFKQGSPSSSPASHGTHGSEPLLTPQLPWIVITLSLR